MWPCINIGGDRSKSGACLLKGNSCNWATLERGLNCISKTGKKYDNWSWKKIYVVKTKAKNICELGSIPGLLVCEFSIWETRKLQFQFSWPYPTTCPFTKLELGFSGLRALPWVWFCPVRLWTSFLECPPTRTHKSSFILVHLRSVFISLKRPEWYIPCNFQQRLLQVYPFGDPNVMPRFQMSLEVILKQNVYSSFSLWLCP